MNLLLSLLLSATAAFAAEPPRLAVLIVVDQMPAEYLDRFAPYFGEKGFKRLAGEGIRFAQAHHSHAVTMTAPGHAVLGSGLYPSQSGIIANEWWDRTQGRAVTSVQHPEGQRAWRFDGQTMAKRLKFRYPDAKVYGVALKDRGAILPTGAEADAAFWFGREGFTTSSAYAGDHSAILAFNTKLSELAAARMTWNYELSASTDVVCKDDLIEHHMDVDGLGKTFPHKAASLGALRTTPVGNEIVAEFAKHVVETAKLGADAEPDFLSVSFSGTDLIGHAFGPDSCETADGMVKLDRDLAGLLDFLEAKVGKSNLIVALSSDHGVAPLPEVSKARGHDAGRLYYYVSGPGEPMMKDLQELENEAAAHFGYAPSDASRLIAYVSEPWVWLSTSTMAAHKIAPAAARTWVKNRFLKVGGIASAVTSEEIVAKKASPQVRRSFRADRSGDVFFELKPYWILSETGKPEGTTHGSDETYDTHVPLLWWGAVPTGTVADRVSTAQVAPTFARIFGLTMDGFSDPRTLPRVVRPIRSHSK